MHVECRPSGLRDPQEVGEERRQQEAQKCEKVKESIQYQKLKDSM